MFDGFILILLGFVTGFTLAWYIIRSESKDEIKKIDSPILFREERNIVIASAEFSVPITDMLYPLSNRWIASELSHKLADEIWKYAVVTMMDDHRNMCRTFEAKLQVLDMGRLNPLCSYGERKGDGNG